MMKNWELALLGLEERAMFSTPRVCFRSFFTPFWANSPLISLSEPPVPLPRGSPPWIMKPEMMRWKVNPS